MSAIFKANSVSVSQITGAGALGAALLLADTLPEGNAFMRVALNGAVTLVPAGASAGPFTSVSNITTTDGIVSTLEGS